MHLPIFADGVTHITAEIAFQRDEGKVYYFNGHLPVFVQAQMLLNKGLEVPEVGRRVGILANTLHKAIRDGRLVHNIKKRYF